MYAVRNNKGQVVGRFATRGEAERACYTSGSPSKNSHWYRVRMFEALNTDRKGHATGPQITVRFIAKNEKEAVARAEAEGGRVIDVEKLGPVVEGSPVRGPERARLLKIHADVSKKLWARSPTYPQWEQSYSNEGFDRAQQLADKMADEARKRGVPGVPPHGYSKEIFATAEKIVRAANRHHVARSPRRARSPMIATSWGVLPPYSDFVNNLARLDEDGKPYLPPGKPYRIEAHANSVDGRLLRRLRITPSGVGQYGKDLYLLSPKQLYGLLKRLSRMDPDAGEGLASGIMSTLGYEWI